jgi:hypothetical protein
MPYSRAHCSLNAIIGGKAIGANAIGAALRRL